jgi:hypothetical protein
MILKALVFTGAFVFNVKMWRYGNVEMWKCGGTLLHFHTFTLSHFPLLYQRTRPQYRCIGFFQLAEH